MYDDVLPLLRCPRCLSGLTIADAPETDLSGEILTADLVCDMNHRIPVEGGILVLSRDDAPSDPWSRSFADYARYANSAAAGIARLGSEGSSILRRLPPAATSPHLDICTGQGSLLFTMLAAATPPALLVSLDMSLHAQTCNRRYLAEHYKGARVSFVAGDASAMPFKDCSFGSVTACAIGNMLNKMPAGIQEVCRLVSPDGVFVFDTIYVEEHSQGWTTALRAMSELNLGRCGYLGLEPDFRRMMDGIGFGRYEALITRDVVGDPDRSTDSGIFPYPNETMREVVVVATR